MFSRSWSTPISALAASFKYQIRFFVLLFADINTIAGKCVQSVDESERIYEETMKKAKNLIFQKLGLAFWTYRAIIKHMEA